MRTIDTNVLVYYLTGSQGELTTRSTELIHRVLTNRESAYIPATVVLECIHVLRTGFNVAENESTGLLRTLLTAPSFHSEHKPALLSALDFASSQTVLSFADCYHLALTKELGMTQIYSFDKKMDRYPGVERIEPELPAKDNV